uniref:Uncharacterized protein n=1 Tax=Avena sativa TaxID=4498 RepID=A0ACD6AIY8_AVESA
MDDATAMPMQPMEGMSELPVKARKPYTITKQREKWTEEEHEKFLEALKLYGRSWRQIQEHIGTKTAVQIRSHAQKFFSKVVREPTAKISIEIPPPRPKRKPLHPYPRKSANSSKGESAVTGQPKLAPVSSSSGSDQENGSPVSVLSAMQSDAFGSSASNPSTRCTSPESSDDENNVPPPVSEDENAPCNQTVIDQTHEEMDQDNKDTGMSEEDSSDEVQETRLKLFGKTVVIPDPRKRCSSDAGHEKGEQIPQSSTKGTSQAPSAGEILPAYTAPNGWVLPYNSYPLHLGETAAPLHMWWPYYGFPVGHPRGPPSAAPHNEATDESDTVKSPPVESSSDDSDDSTQAASKKWKVLESIETTRRPRSASTFELKPSMNSAFVRVKPVSGGDQPVRGFVPYKRCRAE